MDNTQSLNKMKHKPLIKTKILSLGNSQVGKSCIIKRFCERRFVSKYQPTIGIDYGVTKVNLEGKDVRVNIFDMAGHPIFFEVRNEFYLDTHGVMLVYDVTNRTSFESLDFWLAEMNQELMNFPNQMENTIFIVCANKVDLKARLISESEGRLWADNHGFAYFETSAYTNEGISDMFQMLFKAVVDLCEGSTRTVSLYRRIGYTKEQLEAVQQLKYATNEYEKLGLKPGASKEDIKKAYRRLAVLLHPDKSLAPGSEDAFKILVATKMFLMKYSKS